MMEEQLRCDKCGGTAFREEHGVYVCQYCGNKMVPKKAARSGSGAAGSTPVQVNVETNVYPSRHISNKSWLTTLLLCIFLGILGGHRFYAGKTGTGIIWLLTGGVMGIGWAIDLVVIICGNFTDKYGNYIKIRR